MIYRRNLAWLYFASSPLACANMTLGALTPLYSVGVNMQLSPPRCARVGVCLCVCVCVCVCVCARDAIFRAPNGCAHIITHAQS